MVSSVRESVAAFSVLLVSPTGFDGLCLDALHSWEIPFHGTVVAA
jgi:hypothetical protein